MPTGEFDTDVTDAIAALADGSPGAATRWMPVLYGHLRSMAEAHLAGERTGHTLQATALVHEAFLKLAGDAIPFRDAAHFLAVASQAMRHVLVDHARSRGRRKRGGGRHRVPLEGLEPGTRDAGLDLVELDEALGRLADSDPEAARVVEMRFFAGMEESEIASVLGVSERSVRRYWVHAKAWLLRELLGDDLARREAV